MKKFLILSFVLLFSVTACTDRDDKIAAINIRVKNTSAVTFDKVQVGGVEMVHENIAPNEFSTYLEYETAYRFAFIEIRSGEETYTLQPTNFVGETPLQLGFYTYELNISETGDVVLNFVED